MGAGAAANESASEGVGGDGCFGPCGGSALLGTQGTAEEGEGMSIRVADIFTGVSAYGRRKRWVSSETQPLWTEHPETKRWP